MITLRDRPVAESTSSFTVTPSRMSPNFTRPEASVTIGVV